MTAPAITIPSYCSVAEAARLMSEHGVNRLPVVKGRPSSSASSRGPISSSAFVRSDEDIRGEIKEDLLLRNLLARSA